MKQGSHQRPGGNGFDRGIKRKCWGKSRAGHSFVNRQVTGSPIIPTAGDKTAVPRWKYRGQRALRSADGFDGQNIMNPHSGPCADILVDELARRTPANLGATQSGAASRRGAAQATATEKWRTEELLSAVALGFAAYRPNMVTKRPRTSLHCPFNHRVIPHVQRRQTEAG